METGSVVLGGHSDLIDSQRDRASHKVLHSDEHIPLGQVLGVIRSRMALAVPLCCMGLPALHDADGSRPPPRLTLHSPGPPTRLRGHIASLVASGASRALTSLEPSIEESRDPRRKVKITDGEQLSEVVAAMQEAGISACYKPARYFGWGGLGNTVNLWNAQAPAAAALATRAVATNALAVTQPQGPSRLGPPISRDRPDRPCVT